MIANLASRNQFKAATKSKTIFGTRKPILKAIGQGIDEAHAETGIFEQCRALIRLRAHCENWFAGNADKVSYTPNPRWFGGTGSHRYDGVTAIAAQVDHLLNTTYSNQFAHYRRLIGSSDTRIARKGLKVRSLSNDDYVAEFLDTEHRSKAGQMYAMYRNPDIYNNATGLTFQEWLGDRTIQSANDAHLSVEMYGDPKQVIYLDGSARIPYRLKMQGGRYFRDIDGGAPFDTAHHESAPRMTGWAIFVLSPSGYLYAHSKDVGRFHHSTFLSGRPTAAAGCIAVKDGVIVAQNNASGHYQPGADQQLQFCRAVQKQMTRAVGDVQAKAYMANTLRVSTSLETFGFNGPYYSGAHFLESGGNPTTPSSAPQAVT